MSLSRTINTRMIVGLGITGLSAARWCQRMGYAFDVCDTRTDLTNLDVIKTEFPNAKVYLGQLDAEVLSQYDELVVSPGISINEFAIQLAASRGVVISGDIQLFVERCTKPIIAITGSNGKSTVTTLVGELLAFSGKSVGVGGNIGLAALDMPECDIYVLELSSFQLETTRDLHAQACVILNLSEDHLDRYAGMDTYLAAKQRIFLNAKNIIANRDDVATFPPNRAATITFGLNAPKTDEFGLVRHQGESWIFLGDNPLIAASELKIKGQHNLANAMAALALIQAAGVDVQSVLPALRTFGGLDHRCQWLGAKNGVEFYNDSKGTNVGSTLAALNGLGPEITGKIWLLAGGEGKGQDFSPLAFACQQYVAEVVVFGADAEKIAQAVQSVCKVNQQPTMVESLTYAFEQAKTGDVILLSPACASFDQFKNYVHRGECFRVAVEAVL